MAPRVCRHRLRHVAAAERVVRPAVRCSLTIVILMGSVRVAVWEVPASKDNNASLESASATRTGVTRDAAGRMRHAPRAVLRHALRVEPNAHSAQRVLQISVMPKATVDAVQMLRVGLDKSVAAEPASATPRRAVEDVASETFASRPRPTSAALMEIRVSLVRRMVAPTDATWEIANAAQAQLASPASAVAVVHASVTASPAGDVA